MEDSIFTKIIKGEIPCHKIYEDDEVLSFLTINPVTEGHTLVVPKKQIDEIWDLEQGDYTYLWLASQKIALHIKDVMNTDRVGVVVKGFEVPHTHIHLIPVDRYSGLNFDPEPAPPRADEASLAEVAAKLAF